MAFIKDELGARTELEQSMRKLIEQKVKHYSQYKYFIVDYEITHTVLGTWDLSVSSFDFSRLAAMRNQLLKGL